MAVGQPQAHPRQNRVGEGAPRVQRARGERRHGGGGGQRGRGRPAAGAGDVPRTDECGADE